PRARNASWGRIRVQRIAHESKEYVESAVAGVAPGHRERASEQRTDVKWVDIVPQIAGSHSILHQRSDDAQDLVAYRAGAEPAGCTHGDERLHDAFAVGSPVSKRRHPTE